IIIYHQSTDSFGITNTSGPDFLRLAPGADDTITAPAGSLVTDGIIWQINAASFPQIGAPMPFVGLRINDGSAVTTNPGPAFCEGSPLSDLSGQVHCNLRVGCRTGFFGMGVEVGEYRNFPVFINITSGVASQIVANSGNNQTGRGGDTLPASLSAIVN